MDAKEFGSELRRIRKSKGLTLEEAGEKIGYSQPFISMLENGKKGIPKPETLQKIANGLGADYNYLMQLAGYIDNEESLIKAFKNVLAGGSDSIVNGFYQESEDGILSFKTLNFPINDIHFHLTDKENGKTYKTIALSDNDRKMMVALIEAYLIEKLSQEDNDNSKQIEILRDSNFSLPSYFKLNNKEGD